MRNKFLLYAILVVLCSSMASWGSMAQRATGGRGSGNSWYAGGHGGGWASGGGGGHK